MCYYQSVVAAVLLYGSETWCVREAAKCPLGSSHVEVARRITGKMRYKFKRGKERGVGLP